MPSDHKRRSSGPVRSQGSTSDPLQSLREATKSLHEQLDSSLSIAHAEACLDDYVIHLQTLRQWFSEVQSVLRRSGESVLDDAGARIGSKLVMIDADLHDLGATYAPAAFDPVATRPLGNWETKCTGYAWGVAYVIEGSELGAQALFRRLRERLAPHPLRYLAGPGAEIRVAIWSNFVSQLRSDVVAPALQLDAQRGAVAAFALMVSAFGLEKRSVDFK